MKISFVTNEKILNEFRKSKYWQNKLGFISTVEKNGSRIANEKDQFSFVYNNLYKTNIHMKGSIGDLNFYLDYYIRDDIFAVYYNSDEFVNNFDFEYVKGNGIDKYIGSVLKKIETENKERVEKAEQEKLLPKKQGNADTLKVNPGAATYDDIKEYLRKKSESRFGS